MVRTLTTKAVGNELAAFIPPTWVYHTSSMNASELQSRRKVVVVAGKGSGATLGDLVGETIM